MATYKLEHQVTSNLTSDASSTAEDENQTPASNNSVDESYHLQRRGHENDVIGVGNSSGEGAGEFVDQQLFFVTSYSDFDKLAHGPRGHEGKHTLRIYRFLTDGSLVLLHISGEGKKVINPAFSRFHPR